MRNLSCVAPAAAGIKAAQFPTLKESILFESKDNEHFLDQLLQLPL